MDNRFDMFRALVQFHEDGPSVRSSARSFTTLEMTNNELQMEVVDVRTLIPFNSDERDIIYERIVDRKAKEALDKLAHDKYELAKEFGKKNGINLLSGEEDPEGQDLYAIQDSIPKTLLSRIRVLFNQSEVTLSITSDVEVTKRLRSGIINFGKKKLSFWDTFNVMEFLSKGRKSLLLHVKEIWGEESQKTLIEFMKVGAEIGGKINFWKLLKVIQTLDCDTNDNLDGTSEVVLTINFDKILSAFDLDKSAKRELALGRVALYRQICVVWYSLFNYAVTIEDIDNLVKEELSKD